MQQEEEGLTSEGAEQLAKGRVLLGIALVAGLLAIPALLTNRPGLFLVCWVATFLGGLGGISNVARARDRSVGSNVVRYASFVSLFMPFLNVLPLAYYLVRAHAGLKSAAEQSAAEDGALARARARQAASHTPAPKASPARPEAQLHARQVFDGGALPAGGTNAPRGLARAIASVKRALPPGTPEGTVLSIKMPQAPGVQALDLPVFRAAKGFAVAYLIDEGNQFTYANAGQLRNMAITPDQLHEIGVRNLAALVNGKPGLKLLPQDGFFGLTVGGHFEASLVLLDELWDGALKQHTPNGVIVAIPARDICAFCDAGSEKGVAELRRVIERITQGGDHLVSDKLLTRRNGLWEEFQSSKSSGLAPLELR